MTQPSWKTSDFIEVKTNLQKYILRIILFLKTAVSINDSLDPGPQAIAGLRHGIPVEGPHHLLYLLDQILGFVERLSNDPHIRPKQNSEKSGNQASCGRPDLLLLHLRNSALIGVSKNPLISIMVRPAQSPKTVPVLRLPVVSSCRSAAVCFYLCFGRQLRRFCGWKIIKKDNFLMRWWSFESVPEISLPPCIYRKPRENSSLAKNPPKYSTAYIVQQSNCRWHCEPTCFSSLA